MALFIDPGRRRPPPAETPRPESDFSQARDYAALYHGSTPTARFFNERLAYVLRYLESHGNGRLLDVGCGPGILLARLARSRFDLFGIDRSAAMIEEAEARTAHHPIHLKVGQVEHLPYPSGFFDVILALGVLEYVPDIDAAIAELARVARPNAIILVSMLNRTSVYWFLRRHFRRPWTGVRPPIADRGGETEAQLKIHRKAHLIRLMRQRGIQPGQIVYFGVDICLAPLASRYPRLAKCILTAMDAGFGKVLRSYVYTAFLIIASIGFLE